MSTTAADQIRELISRTTPKEAEELVTAFAEHHKSSFVALSESTIVDTLTQAINTMPDRSQEVMHHLTRSLAHMVADSDLSTRLNGVLAAEISRAAENALCFDDGSTDTANLRFGARLWSSTAPIVLADSQLLSLPDVYHWANAQRGRTVADVISFGADMITLDHEEGVDLNALESDTNIAHFQILAIEDDLDHDARIAQILTPNEFHQAVTASGGAPDQDR